MGQFSCGRLSGRLFSRRHFSEHRDKQSDQLIFDFNDICSKFIEEPTKRSIIQYLASIYDPLGLMLRLFSN